MTTLMTLNLKLLSDASSETVDATMCHQMIGSLICLTNMRPDICFVVNTLRHVHLMVAKHAGLQLSIGSSMMRMKILTQRVMLNQIGQAVPLIGRSTSRCCFSMGSGVISWFSRKQSCVVLSTAEAEYAAACLASCEEVWLRKLLSDLFDIQLDATCIHCDNQS